MSILIKGIELPKNCAECFVARERCHRTIEWYKNNPQYYDIRHEACPLVEVPTPHGRLIDGEKAKEELRRAEALTRAFGYHNVIETISEVPTIIEAEKGVKSDG